MILLLLHAHNTLHDCLSTHVLNCLNRNIQCPLHTVCSEDVIRSRKGHNFTGMADPLLFLVVFLIAIRMALLPLTKYQSRDNFLAQSRILFTHSFPPNHLKLFKTFFA